MKCEHEFEILDVIQVVGWDDSDLAIPCLLEVNQCSKCGLVDESVTEGNLELDTDNPYDIMDAQ